MIFSAIIIKNREENICYNSIIERVLWGGRSRNPHYIKVLDIFNKSYGFTLTEILIATGIVGLIAALVLPSLVKNFQTKALDSGFTRQYQAIQSAVNSLVVNENKADFFTTSMYVNETPESYTDSSGKFIKKYLKVNKYCGDNNGDCFAPKYYEFKDNDKIEYTPEFKGACASLKNGMSLCLTPQIGITQIHGLLDVNGKKGPNVLGLDLREFFLDRESRKVKNQDTEVVYVTDPYKPDGIGGGGTSGDSGDENDPCDEEPGSEACCNLQGITEDNKSDCCWLADPSTPSICYKEANVNIGFSCSTNMISSNLDAERDRITYTLNIPNNFYKLKNENFDIAIEYSYPEINSSIIVTQPIRHNIVIKSSKAINQGGTLNPSLFTCRRGSCIVQFPSPRSTSLTPSINYCSISNADSSAFTRGGSTTISVPAIVMDF